ncbi:MAG TPA: hypothetical protein VGA69_00300 [Nitriliruptorales bacterium]
MWARISTYEGAPEAIDPSTAYVRESILPKVRGIPGYRGIYAVADRTSGRTMSITLWDSEEALRASEADADRLRNESTEQADGSVVSVERFEVTLSELV